MAKIITMGRVTPPKPVESGFDIAEWDNPSSQPVPKEQMAQKDRFGELFDHAGDMFAGHLIGHHLHVQRFRI